MRNRIGIKMDQTPMADVIFLLLIFFMLSSSFVMQPGIKVKLPKAVTSESEIEKTVVLTITEDRKIYLDKKLVDIDILGTKLSSTFKKKGVSVLVIKADRNVDFGIVVRAMDIAKLNGAEKIAVATEPALKY